jgi:hypothetical protein
MAIFRTVAEGDPLTAVMNWTFYRDRYARLILRLTRGRRLYLRLRWGPAPFRLFCGVQKAID